MRSPGQQETLVRIETLTAVIAGYVDHVLDTTGRGLIGSYGKLTEALRRRRVEATEGERFAARLLGLELGRGQYERGAAFVRGVVERAGDEGLPRLWVRARAAHPRRARRPRPLAGPHRPAGLAPQPGGCGRPVGTVGRAVGWSAGGWSVLAVGPRGRPGRTTGSGRRSGPSGPCPCRWGCGHHR